MCSRGRVHLLAVLPAWGARPRSSLLAGARPLQGKAGLPRLITRERVARPRWPPDDGVPAEGPALAADFVPGGGKRDGRLCVGRLPWEPADVLVHFWEGRVWNRETAFHVRAWARYCSVSL